MHTLSPPKKEKKKRVEEDPLAGMGAIFNASRKKVLGDDNDEPLDGSLSAAQAAEEGRTASRTNSAGTGTAQADHNSKAGKGKGRGHASVSGGGKDVFKMTKQEREQIIDFIFTQKVKTPNMEELDKYDKQLIEFAAWISESFGSPEKVN